MFQWDEDEIPKFNKQWLLNASLLIKNSLVQQKPEFHKVAHEVIKDYKIAAKKAILNYSKD